MQGLTLVGLPRRSRRKAGARGLRWSACLAEAAGEGGCKAAAGLAYELMLARRDGRLGANMKPAEFDCEPFLSGQRPTRESPVDPATGAARCAPTATLGGGVTTGGLNGYRVARLATYLQPNLERFVVDNTGLTGGFDIELTYEDERFVIPGVARDCRACPSRAR